MKLVTWESYVPNVEDNRARFQREEPAIVVTIRAATALVWMAFLRAALTTDAARVAALRAAGSLDAGLLQLALLDEALGAILWQPSVGAITGFPHFGEQGSVADGAALWALRDQLDSLDLYSDILRAIVVEEHRTAGLVSTLRAPAPAPAEG